MRGYLSETGLIQGNKNVDIPNPHSEVLRIPALKDKLCPRFTQTFTTCSHLMHHLKFLRFQNVTEQIANAMVYNMLVGLFLFLHYLGSLLRFVMFAKVNIFSFGQGKKQKSFIVFAIEKQKSAIFETIKFRNSHFGNDGFGSKQKFLTLREAW